MEDLAELHRSDQVETGINHLIKLFGLYYNGLVAAGLPEALIMELTLQYQEMVLTNASD